MNSKTIHTYDDRTTRSMKTWIQLLRSFKSINTKELNYITKCGLSMNQFEILEALYHKGDLKIGEITRLIMSTPGNVTVVVKNLSRDGLIEISKDATDKRSQIASITPLGEEKIASMFGKHSQNLKSFFDEFNDEELDSLFAMLRRLYKFNRQEEEK
ncbi:MAG: MarR family winged helix-turn-helix transcriptional regulator [Campylobacteraceae bacterium]